MYLAIIVLPLFGSIVSGFFGRKVGVSGAQLITNICIIITTFVAIIIFSEVGLNSIAVSILTFRWVDSESLNVLWGFNFDSLTVSMLIPVLVVSSLVHVYSIGYMSHDPHNQRFFSYLSLFTFMMIILVTANNFLLMFVGWEGVGVCSYLLVSFWFTRIAANQSSMSAFLTNRIGDCFLTLAMFAMLWTFGNLDYSTVFSLAPFVNENVVTIIGICLLIGAMAKSSQIGLHVWLPLAMEGPTPVSALIHAATMVTAGVYLLMRASPLIEYSSTVLIISLWVGSITTVFSSLIGLFQQDIKKVIAYSTMSQLGMMVIAVGLSSYSVALFHLVNHAFYKGLLFLGAGAVIHAVTDNQDFRKYGGMLLFLPLTYTVMLIASLSLVAFPFMTGFYSKDFILESAFAQFQYTSVVVYFTATVAAMFTTLYSVKVLYLTFLTSANGPIVNYNKAHEGDIFMSLPLIILALFSIFFGYITKDMFIGLASGFYADNSLFIHPLHEIVLNTEFAVPVLFKLLPMILTVTLTILCFVLFEFFPISILYLKFTRLGYNTFSFLNLRFIVEFIYNRFVTSFILKLGGQTTKTLDKGSVERLGPHGLEKGLINLSHNISKLDTAVVTSYALYILIASMLYILIPYIFIKDFSILLLVFYSLFIFSSSGKLELDLEAGAYKNHHVFKSNLWNIILAYLKLGFMCWLFLRKEDSINCNISEADGIVSEKQVVDNMINYKYAVDSTSNNTCCIKDDLNCYHAWNDPIYSLDHTSNNLWCFFKNILNKQLVVSEQVSAKVNGSIYSLDHTSNNLWCFFKDILNKQLNTNELVSAKVNDSIYSLDHTSNNLWCLVRDGLLNINMVIYDPDVKLYCVAGIFVIWGCFFGYRLYNFFQMDPAIHGDISFSIPADVNDPIWGFLGTFYSYKCKYIELGAGTNNWCYDTYHRWVFWDTSIWDPLKIFLDQCLQATVFSRIFVNNNDFPIHEFSIFMTSFGETLVDYAMFYEPPLLDHPQQLEIAILTQIVEYLIEWWNR